MARLTADLEGGQTSADVLHRPKTAARVCAWEHIAVVSPPEIRFLGRGREKSPVWLDKIGTIRCETLDGGVPYMVIIRRNLSETQSNRASGPFRVEGKEFSLTLAGQSAINKTYRVRVCVQFFVRAW